MITMYFSLMIEACFFPQTFDPEILMVWAFL